MAVPLTFTFPIFTRLASPRESCGDMFLMSFKLIDLSRPRPMTRIMHRPPGNHNTEAPARCHFLQCAVSIFC